jgi:hypothetical protein
MPNDFELAFGLNPNLATDADLDSDGDGASNLAEFLAGTRPDQSNSVLRISSQRQSYGTDLLVNSTRGKTYRFEGASTVTGPWTAIADNLAGTGSSLRVVDVSASPFRFYKVRCN